MKRLFLLMCLLLMFLCAGCVPSSVTISGHTESETKDIVISNPKELKFLDQISKLEFDQTRNDDICQYSYEWNGTLYEVTVATGRILIKKGELSAVIDDTYSLNMMRTLLGLQPSKISTESIQFTHNEKIHEVVMTDLKTGKALSIPEHFTSTIIRTLREKGLQIVPVDVDYYREKQSQLESGNELMFNLTFYNIYGEIELNLDVYQEGMLAEHEDQLIKSKESLIWLYNNQAIIEQAEEWFYDEKNYVVRGEEYSRYPLEINLSLLKVHDEEANYPVYELEVINHSDKELVLFRAYTETGSNSYYIERELHLNPNEQKTVLASIGYGHMGNFTMTESEMLDYIYYDLSEDKVYKMEHGLKSKENKETYRYVYDFGIKNTYSSYVYYVDLKNERYGVIEGFDLPKDEIDSYWWEKPSTILDFLLREGNRIINIVETEVKLTDKLKDEIQKLADEHEIEVLFDFYFTTDNYNEMKNLNNLMTPATLVKATDGSNQLWLNEYSTPMIITREDRKAALNQNLPLSDLPQKYIENYGHIGGINRILSCTEQDQLEQYFKDHLKNSYTYLTFLGEEELGAMKPVIYLYNDEDLSVHVDTEKTTTLTYPDIGDGWDVDLKDNRMFVDGKEIRALYYEAMIPNVFDTSEGFVVHRNEAASFLEEKLSYMGLNELEIYDFIVFWLPYFHENEYTLVSFQNDIYTELYPLKTSIDPDTQLRIYMIIQGLDHKIEIPVQQLKKGTERKGFTLIEWGGSILEQD